MKLWQSLTGIAALIFCGTSLVFTVQLWVSMPAGLGGQLVAGATAVALELCKFSFAPLGLWLRNQGQVSGYALLSLWPLLVLISIVATVGFLATHSEEQQQRSARNSQEYRALQQQLNSLQQQINTLNGLINTDANNGYRQRALHTAAQLSTLETERTQLIEKLSTIEQTPSTHSAFSSLAGTLKADPAKVQHIGFLVLAIITDIVGLVALLAFNAAATVAKRATKPLQQPETLETQPLHTAHLNEEQQQLAQRISVGEFGPKPVMRNIIKDLRLRYETVNPVFKALQQAGTLNKNGRGYFLASQGGLPNG
ncbi:hypothetical protein [uncultured Microbulbifer sp.]|uniref:hypothetical protein n=1 Tax=uncultured Microbulbifer sp. TaxID=348147 RepID=UPI00260A6D33|nr:hypothetical protein [uncultured Microbulbifer sp.]